MTDYLIIRTKDGAEYAVPEGAQELYPGAEVIGREGPTGVPQPLEEPAKQEEPAPEVATVAVTGPVA